MRTVAIIGAGIGLQHLEGYLALPEIFRIKTLIGRALDVLTELNVEVSGIAVGDDFAGVLADFEIDIVNICLPPHLHLSASLDALAAGKHVVCEKPLVASLKDADTLIAAAREAERLIVPVFQYRYGPAMAQFLALQDETLRGVLRNPLEPGGRIIMPYLGGVRGRARVAVLFWAMQPTIMISWLPCSDPSHGYLRSPRRV